MAELNIFFYFFMLSLFLFLTAAGKAFILRKENNFLTQHLSDAIDSLEKARKHIAEIDDNEKRASDYQSSMSEVAFTPPRQNIQQSKIYLQERSRNSPERYSYVHSLAGKGLSSDEIASILSISTHEAGQLMALAKIAQGN